MTKPQFAKKQTYTYEEALAKHLGTTVAQVQRMLDQLDMEQWMSREVVAEVVAQEALKRLRESGVLGEPTA